MTRSESWPGYGMAALAAVLSVAAATGLARLGVGGVSALLVALVLGILVTNTTGTPVRADAGLKVVAKRWLRLGIVLMGLRVSLTEVLGLGWGVVALAVGVVLLSMGGAWVAGGWLGVAPASRLLVGAGTGICGAAAIIAVEDEIRDRTKQDVVSALALIVLFGTLMIPLAAAGSRWLGLAETQAGVWAGASVHEVAQVVAAAGLLGPQVLKVAVVVKLTRVLMLAPTVVAVRLIDRSRARGDHPTGATGDGSVAQPHTRHLVPFFVIGFLAMVLARATLPIPGPVLEAVQLADSALLAAAMFALGTTIHRSALAAIPARTAFLGLAVTSLVAVAGLAGALLLF